MNLEICMLFKDYKYLRIYDSVFIHLFDFFFKKNIGLKY